jgi:hypothetical protein
MSLKGYVGLETEQDEKIAADNKTATDNLIKDRKCPRPGR